MVSLFDEFEPGNAGFNASPEAAEIFVHPVVSTHILFFKAPLFGKTNVFMTIPQNTRPFMAGMNAVRG
jgi:hypothetical protein